MLGCSDHHQKSSATARPPKVGRRNSQRRCGVPRLLPVWSRCRAVCWLTSHPCLHVVVSLSCPDTGYRDACGVRQVESPREPGLVGVGAWLAVALLPNVQVEPRTMPTAGPSSHRPKGPPRRKGADSSRLKNTAEPTLDPRAAQSRRRRPLVIARSSVVGRRCSCYDRPRAGVVPVQPGPVLVGLRRRRRGPDDQHRYGADVRLERIQWGATGRCGEDDRDHKCSRWVRTRWRCRSQ